MMRVDAVSRIYNTYSTQMASSAKDTDKAKSKDEVDFSTQAKDFAAIKKMLSDVPEVREDKVQDIKQRMENGTYNVSSEEVASKILSQTIFRV
ncbi:MAG: flagellar biosynthesis anti-sigma factor FlgM [Cellulosilyticum sp.]|nr:flagellar biosynthesis anti-sigma factor FlgM [Cellulosilyticum sp.]